MLRSNKLWARGDSGKQQQAAFPTGMLLSSLSSSLSLSLCPSPSASRALQCERVREKRERSAEISVYFFLWFPVLLSVCSFSGELFVPHQSVIRLAANQCAFCVRACVLTFVHGYKYKEIIRQLCCIWLMPFPASINILPCVLQQQQQQWQQFLQPTQQQARKTCSLSFRHVWWKVHPSHYYDTINTRTKNEPIKGISRNTCRKK